MQQPYLKSLKVLHNAMVTGIFMIGMFLYFGSKNKSPNDIFDDIVYLIIGMCIGLVFIGNLLFSKKLIKIRILDGLENKMNEFRTAFVLRMAFLEGPALILFMFGFVTKIQIFFIVGFFIAALMLLIAPSKEKIASLLQLNNQEERELV